VDAAAIAAHRDDELPIAERIQTARLQAIEAAMGVNAP
jgi:hypothetical protein